MTYAMHCLVFNVNFAAEVFCEHLINLGEPIPGKVSPTFKVSPLTVFGQRPLKLQIRKKFNCHLIDAHVSLPS